MGLHTADALVLRRYPFRETSVIVSCLTEEFGKLKGLVKGLRATPSRYRSAMEPFTANRIVFYDTQHSQLHLISQCELMQPFEGLHRDLDVMRAAAFCLELSDTVLPLEQPHPGIYRLLHHALSVLAGGAVDVAGERARFTVTLLRLSGFQPQLTACTGCDSSLASHEPRALRLGFASLRASPELVEGRAAASDALSAWSWSARQGGLLCPRCAYEDPEAQPMPPPVLEALGRLTESEEGVSLDPDLSRSLARYLDEFLRWRLDCPLKTLTT